jgi:hypothetical protein
MPQSSNRSLTGSDLPSKQQRQIIDTSFSRRVYMSQVDGSYDCVTKSPMGDQKSVFTVNSNGDSFTGQNAGAMGSLDVENGKVEGNKLTWTMNMKVPMPMVLECEATIDGDTLTGAINAGPFGAMPMSGTRQS